ncbi:MAG: GTPase ObgE, GTP-binding protein [Candidatus Parcubacteria bacterium]|jgi:GTP-binding protein
MSFVDEIKIHLSSGKGGDGVVRWLHLKGKEYSGPAGGNGGKGGDVYIRAIRNSSILDKYTQKVEMHAGNGEDGGHRSRTGADGEDLIIDLSLGSYVKNLETGIEYELLEDGQTIKILHGGNGGLGNEMFKGPINRAPEQQTNGKPGEEADFHIELRLIADYGLIGLPNAGKSTLLNTLTNSKSKVGNYKFTTLEPHLGDMYGVVIADIPGLIEGASEGKGLGHKFLRHITRTKTLMHCISAESENIEEDYETIRKELRAFSPDLVHKEEIILITKMDYLDDIAKTPKDVILAKARIQELFSNKEVFFVSILDDESIKTLKKRLNENSSVDK